MLEELFFDRLMEARTFMLKEAELQSRLSMSIGDKSNLMTFQDFYTRLTDYHIFLVNGAVVDDLYNIPCSPHTTEDFHLPFPEMFLEFIDPIEHDGKMIKAVSLTMPMPESSDYSDYLRMGLHILDSKGKPATIWVSSSLNITPFLFKKEVVFYGIGNKETGSFDPNLTILNLSVNLIDYVNAHNLTIRKADRETRSPEELDRINRHRLKKGKKPILPLAPYHWIEVKQHVIDDKKRDFDEESKMEYKEWVRGHFRRYHTREGLERYWIEPYVRGPADKPWKENRYKVLDDMLRRGPRYSQ